MVGPFFRHTSIEIYTRHIMVVIERGGLHRIFQILLERGYTPVGPTVRDRAVVLDILASVDDLPAGWEDVHQPAGYTLERTGRKALFGHTVGPHAWKKFLYPPRTRLCTLTKEGKAIKVAPVTKDDDPPKFAFIGVRPCDLAAIGVQDRVFTGNGFVDSTYQARRRDAFILAVNCTRPTGNCFCTSMGTGPQASSGFDLAVTEVEEGDTMLYLVDAGTEIGEEILKSVDHRVAEPHEVEAGERAHAQAVKSITKSMATDRLPQRLVGSFDHQEWDDVARRCLSCANCTMVCPTCFCSTVEDVTDLDGASAERWRRWDSCFTMDFARVAGGNFRPSAKSRYRQWLMHKLAYWHEQFGSSGCVGCGRCITWCPVGIDITEEARRLSGNGKA
jgi:sulfhydrogenase subunit beta (sulfur reductase)